MTPKTISTQPTDDNIGQLMEILASVPDRLANLSDGLSDSHLREPLGPVERSFTQDLAHLINSEARSSEAIYLALLVDNPQLISVHSERQWGQLLRFDLFPFAELLAYFRLRRAVLLQVLACLGDAQWLRTVRESGKKRQESVYWKARALAMHELDHLEDLTRKLG